MDFLHRENEEVINIIWIENIISDENTKYYNEIYKTIKQNCLEYKIFMFKVFQTLDKALEYIKRLKFEASIIIISGLLYYNFIIEFNNNINNIYIIPKIIIFTKTEKIIRENKSLDKIIKNRFYNYGGIHTSIEDIIKFIINEIKSPIPEISNQKFIKFKKDYFGEEFIFEYIDKKEKLLLPMSYKVLLESNPTYSNYDFILNLYYNIININSHKNDALKKLLKSIISIQDIPIQLLSKYYARIFTYDSDFY